MKLKIAIDTSMVKSEKILIAQLDKHRNFLKQQEKVVPGTKTTGYYKLCTFQGKTISIWQTSMAIKRKKYIVADLFDGYTANNLKQALAIASAIATILCLHQMAMWASWEKEGFLEK